MRKLRSLETAGPEWEGHERADALIRSSGVRVDHVAGDRACYSLKDDRVVLPERSQFPSQDAYTHTALHELGHATGHPSRLNRPTLVDHGGFGTETYAREELRAEIPRVAAAPFPLVIEGESGTGKELVARAIHEEGPRGRAVFVPVNCAVLGDELCESELFGHARGAFTGASQDRKGLLELSSGGTVFLDEVAELTPRAQAKLLRVLQDGEIRRLGENRTQRLDLRVVAATNRPLDAEAAAGRFRSDLLYRLKVLRVTAPPLRDHGPDVARLTDHYWKDIAAAAGSRATLARETVAALAAHPWPGNVRELQNVLAKLDRHRSRLVIGPAKAWGMVDRERVSPRSHGAGRSPSRTAQATLSRRSATAQRAGVSMAAAAQRLRRG